MNKNNEDLKNLLAFMIDLGDVLNKHKMGIVADLGGNLIVYDSDDVDQWDIDYPYDIAAEIKTIKEMLDDEQK